MKREAHEENAATAERVSCRQMCIRDSPSTADLAGRCLEMLATLGYDWTHPAVASALTFVKNDQEQDGSWYGRWGVNYIYGTWSVLSLSLIHI